MLGLSAWAFSLIGSATLLYGCHGLQQDTTGKHAPTWRLPLAYEAQFIFSIPYTDHYLPSTLHYPVHLWVNHKTGFVRMDVDSDEYMSGVNSWGLDSSISREGSLYFRTPRIDQYTCLVSGSAAGGVHSASTGIAHVLKSMEGTPTRPSDRKLLQDELPGFSKWKFSSEIAWRGVKAEKWIYHHKIQDRVSRYEVIVSLSGDLLYLRTMGAEYTTGAHFDEYIMDFSSFTELDAEDEAPFTLPPECSRRPLQSGVQPMAVALASLAPDVRPHTNLDLTGLAVRLRTKAVPLLGAPSHDMVLKLPTDFTEFSERQGRTHRDDHERRQRALAYVHHSMAIKRHNLRLGRRFTMAENRFTDWLEPEFSQLLGFKRYPEATAAVSAVMRGEPDPTGGPRTKFQCAAPDCRHTEGGAAVPENVDWRGTGAVGVVKDQGVCGSCWSFSAAQVLASAHYMSTGNFVSLSEQQIMDCSWTYGYGPWHNQACDGGWPELGVQYSIEHGGSFAEKDYPYQGVDDFCRADHGRLQADSEAKPAVHASGLKFVERYNREAVKEALVKYGPLSIGVDAEPVPFRFYSSGVLDDADCYSDPGHIDHAVLLVGYGIEEGVEYWLVKNEWSVHWGDKGYIKIAQEHDCAVATEAFFVTM